jgi:hypothetical protein
MAGKKNTSKPLVWLVCRELGYVNRGFEQYTLGLVRLLQQHNSFSITVAGGGALSDTGFSYFKVPLGRFLPFRKNFRWQQRLFVLAMAPSILLYQPRLLYVGEYGVYTLLWHLRRLLKLKYSLTLYTGGQAVPASRVFHPLLDYVHHVTPAYWEKCVHLPANRQFVLPHFVNNDFVYNEKVQHEIRQLAGNKKIVLSVGLIDRTVKQMDKLIEAISIDTDKWFPVLLGQTNYETPEVISLLNKKFGKGGYLTDTIPHQQLGNWYAAADVFVCCSPNESFGLAMLEAVYHGLPCVVHDFFETRWVLKAFARRVNVNDPQMLLDAIQTAVDTDDAVKQKTRTNFVEQNYSLKAIGAAYHQSFERMVKNEVFTASVNY